MCELLQRIAVLVFGVLLLVAVLAVPVKRVVERTFKLRVRKEVWNLMSSNPE